jgi:hypothetical protein
MPKRKARWRAGQEAVNILRSSKNPLDRKNLEAHTGIVQEIRTRAQYEKAITSILLSSRLDGDGLFGHWLPA